MKDQLVYIFMLLLVAAVAAGPAVVSALTQVAQTCGGCP